MNSEVLRIRKTKNMDEEIYGSSRKIPDKVLMQYQYALNSNMTRVYNAKNDPHTSMNAYIDSFVQNIHLILDMFAEMNVYPDYFYDVVFKRNIDLKKVASESDNTNITNIKNSDLMSGTVGSKIKTGLNNGYNHINSNEKKDYVLNNRDINDYFTEMLSYYQVFGMEYGKNTLEQCKKSFNQHFITITNIMGDFNISDYIYSDVECMVQLLFEYLSFFVEIGVNPKEYLDELIEEKGNHKTK